MANTGFPAKGISVEVGVNHPAHPPKHWKQVVGAMCISSTCRCTFGSLCASMSAQAQASRRVSRQTEPLPKAAQAALCWHLCSIRTKACKIS